LILLLTLSFLRIFCILTIIFFQSLIAHSWGKSLFLCEQRGTWDRLVEEAWLCGEVTAQLVAAQEKVAELTPLAGVAGSLRSQVTEAHRHADEAKRAFEALSVRSQRDDEEATKVRKERDELL